MFKLKYYSFINFFITLGYKGHRFVTLFYSLPHGTVSSLTFIKHRTNNNRLAAQ